MKRKYRSGFEKEVCGELDDKGIDFEYETENLYYEVVEHRKYIPDVILPNGIYIEIKGYLKPKDRKKMKLVIEQHPEKDIRFVFQRPNNKIFKGSKTTYADWCNKNNIKWAELRIPKEWIAEPKKGE